MSEGLMYEQTKQAAYNNAVWCETVCRAHGKPGEFLQGIWVNQRETLPLYPNAVTLIGVEASTKQVAAIRNLLGAKLPGEWAVKDSFCTLDLVSDGFRTLLEAEWLWRPASQIRPGHHTPDVRWATVESPLELGRWEDAWRGVQSGEEHTPQTRIFLPALLEDENVAFIAAYQGQQIVAGAIASRTMSVVGISNIFVPEQDAQHFRAGCVSAVMAAYPGLPLAGYESGEELEASKELGFEGRGVLRIWVRTTGAPAQAQLPSP
jgi:hypothetical protein